MKERAEDRFDHSCNQINGAGLYKKICQDNKWKQGWKHDIEPQEEPGAGTIKYRAGKAKHEEK